MNLNEILKTKVGQDPANRRLLEAAGRSLGAVSHTQRESVSVRTLVKTKRSLDRRQERLGVVVKIVSFRRRLLDRDNLVGGSKSLRDAVAKSLGIDDGDPRLTWEYDQLETTGTEGTLVILTRVVCASTPPSSKSKSKPSTND